MIWMTVLASLLGSATAAYSREFTMEERVQAQEAIEQVYWTYRTWPADNPAPKPPLSAVRSANAIRATVEDYLAKSDALQRYWQRPISSEQMQAEMNRMVANTGRPRVLQALFRALGDDPDLIAECLARPILADRLVRTWYATETRIHGDRWRTADSALARSGGVESMRSLGGIYEEQTLVRGSDSDASESGSDEDESMQRLSAADWNRVVRSLTAQFSVSPEELGAAAESAQAPGASELPLRRIGRLQDDGDTLSVVAVLERADDCLRIARVRWQKLPLHEWWSSQSFDPSPTSAPTSRSYELASAPSGACPDDTWLPTWTGVPDGRDRHVAVWTGSEMIIWGGGGTGARYDPATDTWRPVNTLG